jgi:malonate-semialdehyde dehydrogenase (acetylating)/methylmalonate-semialdehyde dehydrogenase
VSSSVTYCTCHNKIESPVDISNFIDNQAIESKTEVWIDVHDPATNNLVTRVPQTTPVELRAAVESMSYEGYKWQKRRVE